MTAPSSPAPVRPARVALVNSPYILNEPFLQHMPPLSLLYLAAALERAGHVPLLHNLELCQQRDGLYYFGFPLEGLLRRLTDFGPDLIGVTVPYSARWPFARRLVENLKARFPEVPVVVGGIHPTAFAQEVLAESPCDLVVLGEGEASLVELVERLQRGASLDDIDGVAYRHDGAVRVNPKTRFLADLDALPFPAYHLLDMDRLRVLCANDHMSQLHGMYFPLLTSRSCPNQCTYCNMFLAHGRKWRSRSPENVLAEVRHLTETYGVTQFAIMDDNFTFNKDRAKRILTGLIELERPITFLTPNGLSLKALDEELIGLLKRAGALEISIAVESGSEYIRNEVYKKRIRTQSILDVVDACRKHNLKTRAFYMVGAPQETDATVNETIALMRRLRIPGYINITTPYKGTQLYDTFMQEMGLTEADLAGGGMVDIRLPIDKAKNYKQILRWRTKLQFYNMLYSWRELLSTQYLNWNTAKRLWTGVLHPRKITHADVEALMDQWLPPVPAS